MKKSSILLFASALLLAIGLGACRSTQKVQQSYAYYGFDTSLINISSSGMVTVHAWGSGPNKGQALEEAQKNAVADVIFKGFSTSNSYLAKPILNEVNARERYAAYFDRFFAKGGEYRKFVKEASSSDKSRTEATTDGRKNFGMTLIVDRNALVAQLKADGILKTE